MARGAAPPLRARADKADAGTLRPFEHRPDDAFRAVVEDDLPGRAELEGKVVEEPGPACARDRHAGDLDRAVPAMIGDLIAHEVERPALHRPVRRPSSDPIPSRQRAALP
jgi:hypothetical protein